MSKLRRTAPPIGWEHVRNCFPMPNELFLFDLSANALAVYIYLLYCANRHTGQCHPSMPTMAKKLHLSRSTVLRCVKTLEEAGLIATEHTDIVTKHGTTDAERRCGMLMQCADTIIEQEPVLSLQRTLDAQRYIINRWNERHDAPMDADAVRLFLCDERRGALTDEQRTFAKRCKAEIYAAYQRASFRLLLMGEMLRTGLADSPEEFFQLLAPQEQSA